MEHPHRRARWRLTALLSFLAATALSATAWAESEQPRAGAIDLDEAIGGGARRLTVEEAVARAIERAPSVERARASLEVARAGARTAQLAFVPRLDLSARYLRLGGFEDGSISLGSGEAVPTEQALALASAVEDPAAQLLLTAIVEQMSNLGEVSFATPRNQTAFRASLTVPLSDLFLTILPAYRAAQGQVRIEEQRLSTERADVALSVEEAYFRYAQARGSLAVAEAALGLAEEHRDQMAALVRAGLGHEADRLAAEARVASSRGLVARAQGGVNLARLALETLVGLEDDGGELALATSLVEPLPDLPQVTDALVDEALSRRPEARALRELAGVQAQVRRAARGGHSPRLALVASGDVADPNQRVIPPEDEFIPSWEVGLVLSWSPNDSMAAASRTRAAEAQGRIVEADVERLRDGVRLQLEQARVDQASSRAVLDAARERIAAAQAGYEARQAELRAGEAVATQLLDAELELTRARLELISASVDLRVADARFRRALGQ